MKLFLSLIFLLSSFGYAETSDKPHNLLDDEIVDFYLVKTPRDQIKQWTNGNMTVTILFLRAEYFLGLQYYAGLPEQTIFQHRHSVLGGILLVPVSQ